MESQQNVDLGEIAKFEKMAANWWNPQGEFKPLHRLNPLRLDYIDEKSAGLFGKQVLDVGCGGGILSESMARLGAKVTGLDMGTAPLEVAKLHARETGLELTYLQTTAEIHRDEHKQVYDVITCMEMLEHVPNPTSVIQACCEMVKPEGWVFFSTINRNLRSYIEAIIGAEYLLKLLPIGTHEHKKFIKPAELIDMTERVGLLCRDAIGIGYNPLTETFKYRKNMDVNYMIATKKQDT